MTNQKLLAVLLIVFIISATVFFVWTKFKQEISGAVASPSPGPSGLSFLFDNAKLTAQPTSEPASQPVNNTQTGVKQGPQKSQPRSSERPLVKNKRLSQFPGILKPEDLQNKAVVINTAKGIIAIGIYPDVPQAASNFLLLASNGFYDGLSFHRVESGFVVQGGDPNGNGTGGPGYTFADEPVTRKYAKGTVAMAKSGPNTNGSQFFIVLNDDPPLEPLYTIFGAVISGMDVVEKIAVGDVMQRVDVQSIQTQP